MQNIEIKVRVSSLKDIRDLAVSLGAEPQWTHDQTDTYFNVSHGRLKLRETSVDDSGNLISYSRPNETESRISQYRLMPVSDVATLKQILRETLGILVTIEKRRELLIYGSTRIHLDEVDRLGAFVELETVIGDQSPDEAWREHQFVREKIDLYSHEPVSVSYSDLMLEQ